MRLSDSDRAWAAGLFEGEGCFSIEKNGATRCTIRMCDRDVIEHMFELFPSTQSMQFVPAKDRNDGHGMKKPQYAWRIGQPDQVREFIEAVLPWLGTRRTERAREVLHHLDTRPGTGGFYRNKTHCINGHEFTPENTYARKYKKKDGREYYGRRCRICQRAKDVRQREKKK